jgi:hypothetical protein
LAGLLGTVVVVFSLSWVAAYAHTASRPPQRQLGARNDNLRLTIEHDEHVGFDAAALFVKARLRLTNRSDKPKTATAPQIHGTSDWPLLTTQAIEVKRERLRLEGELPKPGRAPLRPREHRVLWLVITFPWRAHGGEPGYVVKVNDEVGNEYGVRRLGRPPKTH